MVWMFKTITLQLVCYLSKSRSSQWALSVVEDFLRQTFLTATTTTVLGIYFDVDMLRNLAKFP